jgi:FixJ family two-component response regulator
MSEKALIAVVDDDPSVLRAMDRLIRAQGYAVRAFSSGISFLESASQVPPDCVIMDVQMPNMTGLELKSRMLERGMTFPVIFITAHEDGWAEARAAELGAVEFLYKPLRNQALFDAVRTALAHSASY